MPRLRDCGSLRPTLVHSIATDPIVGRTGPLAMQSAAEIHLRFYDPVCIHTLLSCEHIQRCVLATLSVSMRMRSILPPASRA